jgi:hypothetical protein
MVRRDNNDYLLSNASTNRRDYIAAGLPVLKQGRRAVSNAFRRRRNRAVPAPQPNGRFAFTRAASVGSTRAALPSRLLRLAVFVDNKWRRDERALKILPRAVILKRFATDLRVLLRAMGFGIGHEP